MISWKCPSSTSVPGAITGPSCAASVNRSSSSTECRQAGMSCHMRRADGGSMRCMAMPTTPGAQTTLLGSRRFSSAAVVFLPTPHGPLIHSSTLPPGGCSLVTSRRAAAYRSPVSAMRSRAAALILS